MGKVYEKSYDERRTNLINLGTSDFEKLKKNLTSVRLSKNLRKTWDKLRKNVGSPKIAFVS